MKAKHLLTITLLLISPYIFSQEKSMQIDELVLREKKEIKCKEYILDLRRWKDGKLATIDGWGRFSTFEITEKDKIKVTPLVKFPRKQIDGLFVTYPEIDVMWSSSFFAVQFFSDIKNNKNVETVPIYTNRYKSKTPYLLDSRKKIFLIPYGSMSTVENYDYLIYDFENDKVIYNPVEKEEDFKKNYILLNFGNGLFLCQERDINDRRRLSNNYCIFDYYKNKCIKNKLTDVLTLEESLEEYPHIIKMNGENRLIITSYGNKIYVTYNDDFSEIKTEYIVSPFFQKMKEKGFETDLKKINQNNEWGVGKIYGYKGLNGEDLYKYFFVNMKKGSPYYLLPVITEEYYEWDPDGYFIEHPVYGTCYIQKIEINDEIYIRLYKMSDVQAKIEEYLLKKAKSILG
ncbi:MAG: hypothetical protein IJ727_12870 [Treponema sp.]|nr:hypothetical protein [Treponema sp.]MBR1723347.1 hypothetical protein [Treponema sp.]